jgi:hypothetical protein
VWTRAAGRCQYDGCNEFLLGDVISGQEDLNSAYLAHIVASNPKGPRGNLLESHALSDDPDNIMLLCDRHHRLIDAKSTRHHYSVSRLKEMKAKHEDKIRMLTEVLGKKETHIVTYSAQIWYNQVLLTKENIKDASIPKYCPKLTEQVRLDQEGLPVNLSDKDFWNIHFDSLRGVFKSELLSKIRRKEIDHVSLFAIAPIPLLIELGRLLSDITPVEVKQLHREPQTWEWLNDRPIVDVSLDKTSHLDGSPVALAVEVSAEIKPDRIYAVLGPDITLWRVKVTGPHNDIIRSRDDLSRCREIIRESYERIKSEHGEETQLHVFPAVPVSVAVEMGRVWQPKAHLPFNVYDQNKARGGFVRVSTVKQEASNGGNGV